MNLVATTFSSQNLCNATQAAHALLLDQYFNPATLQCPHYVGCRPHNDDIVTPFVFEPFPWFTFILNFRGGNAFNINGFKICIRLGKRQSLEQWTLFGPKREH